MRSSGTIEYLELSCALRDVPKSIFSSAASIFCENSDGSERLLSGEFGTNVARESTDDGFIATSEIERFLVFLADRKGEIEESNVFFRSCRADCQSRVEE